MRHSQRTPEEEEDMRHRLIVGSIDGASETLMERNRTGPEAEYWKSTNVVRRNLLMVKVKRLILAEWNPVEVDYQSIADLRALSLRHLLDTVDHHIRYNLTPPSSPPRYVDY